MKAPRPPRPTDAAPQFKASPTALQRQFSIHSQKSTPLLAFFRRATKMGRILFSSGREMAAATHGGGGDNLTELFLAPLSTSAFLTTSATIERRRRRRRKGGKTKNGTRKIPSSTQSTKIAIIIIVQRCPLMREMDRERVLNGANVELG